MDSLAIDEASTADLQDLISCEGQSCVGHLCKGSSLPIVSGVCSKEDVCHGMKSSKSSAFRDHERTSIDGMNKTGFRKAGPASMDIQQHAHDRPSLS